VTWTDEARQMLAARQYRYLSPVAIIHRADRRLVALHSAALTNKPAIVGMEPLVNSASAGIPNAETEIAALSASLALPADAPLVEILAAARARLGAVADENRQRAADERVAIVAAAGKLCEAQRPWALRLALEQPDLFDAWAATAPVLVPLGRTAPPATPSADASRAARAKAEYRGSTLLQSLTSEDAYVAQAARESAR
jgi:phage I-like protein